MTPTEVQVHQSEPVLSDALVIERLYGTTPNTVHVSMHEIEVINFVEFE